MITSFVKALLFAGLLPLLISCSSVQTLRDLDYSLADIQKGVGAVVPKGIAKLSVNRRTMTSKYFDPNSLKGLRSSYPQDELARERATVIVTIFGDQRPYSADIEVMIEEDQSGREPTKTDDFIEGDFKNQGRDKGLAVYFRERLANYLARLERNKNIIDDFRPF